LGKSEERSIVSGSSGRGVGGRGTKIVRLEEMMVSEDNFSSARKVNVPAVMGSQAKKPPSLWTVTVWPLIENGTVALTTLPKINSLSALRVNPSGGQIKVIGSVETRGGCKGTTVTFFVLLAWDGTHRHKHRVVREAKFIARILP
jgi:hypothetical protein